ncbi:hypothetical protein N657DRAFT_693778 [Parathielavia appendiculata]|uniref:Uncharacterized protein n=1 Tax=Parathielavia appendiculata TaxID=2587402 RepID=A0AAN6YYV9_9PEZI|nr:hypothetical protein N657DRAFT_693778 [Parathielavia appendiculata]
MAAEGAKQALVAAFFFGIVLNAASAALVLYLRGCGLASLIRDSQRLVLVLFLLSAALWAQLDFITILVDVSRSPTPCQVGIIFSTVFDQFARFSIEQFLLWGLNTNNGARVSPTQLIPQILVLARFLAGAVFIGFTRPQTETFCVATTSALPIGILVTALDGVIILLLIVRAYFAGVVAKGNCEGQGNTADRVKALSSVILGLVFWTGTSVPLLLGLGSLALATRTALPAGGLLAVIVSVAGGAATLTRPRTTDSRPPEAPSPRRINITRDISTSDTNYPPSRYEDLKDAAIRSSTTFVNPREVPRVKDESSVGFPFGTKSELQEEPVTPLPAITASVSNVAWKLDRTITSKRSLLGFPKGKLAISHPILQENAGRNPLDKIAVMDLQAAAIADKERRARLQEDETAPIGRPAGPLMGTTQEDALKRGVSLKRKEVASVTTRESVFPGALRPELVASTTSAQLSPGGEETRRRSLRQSIQEEPIQARQPSPVHAVDSVEPRSESQQDRPLTILQPLLRPNIRPSRMLPPSPKSPPPEPAKTPLQRRPTIGLPSNPKARGLRVAEEAGSQHRTVLFVNNIEYKDPLAVEAIIQGAGSIATKLDPAGPTAETPGTSSSVVNRPRPIPRKTADLPMQANSETLTHRRSKSGGSLMGRKSLLASSPGSPTQLPPLPSLPKSATMPSRPYPSKTKSMTFEEKVTLLFPSPPSGKTGKRNLPVPKIPRIPAPFMDMDSSPSEPPHHGASKRTTNTSLRTESVLEVDEIPRLPGKIAVNTTGEAGSSWLRAFGDGKDDAKLDKILAAAQVSGKRGSSPILPAIPRVSAWTETTYDKSEDEATNWSSVNSPELAVSVPVVQLGIPSSTQIPASRTSELSFADNRSRETLPIMLDTSTSTMQQADAHGSLVLEVEAAATPRLPTWHRRVGDECPTFSDRKEKTKLRKMCPPAPLSLNSTSTKTILAIQVEPSPLESPGQAIRQIQAQLRKLDELDQATPQSAARRLALLADLEREIGQQAEHWQEIKHDMGRDSMSSMQTTSLAGRDSRHESVASVIDVARGSIRQSIGGERRVSRPARSQKNGNLKVPDAAVRNGGSPEMSKWQKRLTEAQMDYMDAQLLRGSNVTFLQLSRAQLVSPTPPDSDDSEDEVATLSNLPGYVPAEQASEAELTHSSLWTRPSKESGLQTGFLWSSVSKPPPETEVPLPGLLVRPAQRKEWASLRIESSQLWRKPHITANRAASGLWRPVWASAAPPAEAVVWASPKTASVSQKQPHPITQRPPRRNKRVTLLPDILESPEPLPDKRGTLGIFQFPWGEKSDTARIQPRASMYRAMPGTMTSGGPSLGMPVGAGSKHLESPEYSSSFFDYYDNDEDDNMGLDSDEEDSDDGFDETTLWEIASLLKTDALPSRDSLLPPPSGSVVDDYADELTSDEESQSSGERFTVIGLAEPRQPVHEEHRDSATIESSTLLLLEDALESKASPKLAARIGVPADPKPSVALQLSRTAITPVSEVTPASEVSRMPRHTPEVETANTAQQLGSTGLWNPPSQADTPAARGGGLFVPQPRRLGYRGTSEEPAANYICRKPRPAGLKPLESLKSTQLWERRTAVKKSKRNWILGATAKPSESGDQGPHAGRNDWKSALDDAIAADNPHSKLVRVIATPAQSPRRIPEFDSAVRHPVFAASSVVTRFEWSHPAAAGYTYDVSIVHPVFFGSLAITCPKEAVHPTFSAYAARRLEPRRSTQQQRSSDSLSRSSSQTGSRHKDEVPAQTQIRAQEHEGWNEAYTPSAPPLPTPLALERLEISHRNAVTIQAQIEALEQERLLAEGATQEEYRWRGTTTTIMAVTAGETTAGPAAAEVDALMTMPAAVLTVQDLQRQLSMAIRQSLVFAGKSRVASGAVSRAEPKSENKSDKLAVTAAQVEPPRQSSLLWTPIPRLTSPVVSSTTGLWLANSSSFAAPSWTAEEKDAMAASRRRRVVQTRQRRQEMLAQIAAGESVVNAFVDFGGMGLWEYGVGGDKKSAGDERERGLGRDWLHSVCERRTRGVVLRH